MLGDISIKVGEVDIFKQTNGKEGLHGISNDAGVSVVNFATTENIIKSTMIPYPDGKIHSHIAYNYFEAADSETDHSLVVAEVCDRLSLRKREKQKFDVERVNLKN
jgi:hypothetical protein